MGSDDNFKNLDASLTISYILDIYNQLSTITTPFPLSGLVILGPHFNEEISNVKYLLMKNIYPSYLINKQVKRFLHKQFSTNNCNAVKEFKTTLY